MAVTSPITLDRRRLQELIEREERLLNERTGGSGEMFKRANQVLSAGVASSYQLRDPWPIYLERGVGPKVWDVDGNEMWDFHNGFGAMVQGHAHPAIGKALAERYSEGTHFAAPDRGRDRRRRGARHALGPAEVALHQLRLGVDDGRHPHRARLHGPRGRDEDLRLLPRPPRHGDGLDRRRVRQDRRPGQPRVAAYGAGIPQAVVDLTVAVPFNDADAMERRIQRLDAEGRKPACVIMEAAMMNLGIVLPEPGYLEAVREITQRHGIVLIFDEVKTGLTIAAGGATEKWGVKPDMVTLAKALGGGTPTGAIGGNEEVFSVVADGSVYQVGTYNGNPLMMAAVRANLTEVMTPEAYRHLDALNDRILTGCTGVIQKYNLPGYAVGVASKGCVTFATEKIVDYTTFKRSQDKDLSELAWLFNMNRGIFMTPGREEEWTLSVTHTDESVDAYVAVFDEMAEAHRLLTGPPG